MVNWYGTINREHIHKVDTRNYLTYDDAKQIASDFNPDRKYYYHVNYTSLVKKSYIPFVYNTENVTPVKSQLMSEPRD
jgi:hypothetical protein